MDCFQTISTVGTLTGIIISIIIAIINQRHTVKLMERVLLDIAKTRFIDQINPFYHEVCEMTGKDVKGMIGNNDSWSFHRMQQVIPDHRKFINKFRFSIPIKSRHSFNIIADSYCPPQETCTKDDTKAMYWSNDDMKIEMMYRNKIKSTLEKMMGFNI